MFKLGHKHECRESDWQVDVPKRQRYTVLTWRRWFDFLWYKTWKHRTTVFIDRECKYTTLKSYPYQPARGQGQIMVESEDLFEILENLGVRGRVYVICDAINEAVVRHLRYLKDADCHGVWLQFTDKKSAMLAKLALG